MYVRVYSTDFGECQNPNLDASGVSWWLRDDDHLPMGITHVSHACSSLKLPQISEKGLIVTRDRLVMFACHRRFTEMYKSSREGADCNIFVCPQILARYLEEGRMSAYFVILTHTLVVEFDYGDQGGHALHCVPSESFKCATIKHVTPTRAFSEVHFDRSAWMEQNVPEYTKFSLHPRNEVGGPVYLSCVWKSCAQFTDDNIVMRDDTKHQFMPVAKREAHYRAVENGEINCYQCNVQLYSGWRACYKCGAPLTEGTAEEMQLVADTPERREYYESLLTGGKAKRRSARGMANEEKS